MLADLGLQHRRVHLNVELRSQYLRLIEPYLEPRREDVVDGEKRVDGGACDELELGEDGVVNVVAEQVRLDVPVSDSMLHAQDLMEAVLRLQRRVAEDGAVGSNLVVEELLGDGKSVCFGDGVLNPRTARRLPPDGPILQRVR